MNQIHICQHKGDEALTASCTSGDSRQNVNIVLVGFGYWGPNLARNIDRNPSTKLVAIVDSDYEQRKEAEQDYPHSSVYAALSEALSRHPEIGAVVVATPPGTHAYVAREAIIRRKHVLIEKPMTLSAASARSLVDVAKDKNCVLMVDHVYCYSAAARKIKHIIDTEELGHLLYIDSIRINLGLFQTHCDVMWDLAVHDFSLINYFYPDLKIASIRATGTKHYTEHHDSAHIGINYHNTRAKTHIHVNWLSPVKIRQMIIACSQKSIIWNDMDPVEPVKVYDRCAQMAQLSAGSQWQMEYRSGAVLSPQVDNRETLSLMLDEFARAIAEQCKPLTSGYEGFQVVQQLCAASKSLQNDGDKQELDGE